MDTLSDLTDETVDRLFRTDLARPEERPVFLFLIGIPGVGKSSAHKELQKRGYVAPHGYATVNLDTLLESLKVFRQASSMAHLLKQHHKELVKFGTVQVYQSHKEDLGLFKWYDDIHEQLMKRAPVTVKQLDVLRSKYAAASANPTVFSSIQELGEQGLQRAMERSVPIVYETTLSVPRSGRVKKVDDLMALVKRFPQYRVILFHVQGSIEDVATRLNSRQEFRTPSLSMPFYRPMTTALNVLSKIDKGNYDAVKALLEQYPGQIHMDTFMTKLDMSKMPRARSFTLRKQRQKLKTVYGSGSHRSGYSANRSSSSKSK